MQFTNTVKKICVTVYSNRSDSILCRGLFQFPRLLNVCRELLLVRLL